MSHLGVNCPISKGRHYAGAQILRSERKDLKLWITKAGPRTLQTPWTRELFGQSPGTGIKGMLASWNGSIIQSAARKPAFILLHAQHLYGVQKTTASLQEHASSCCQHLLQVLIPALEPVLCSSIQCGALRQVSPISTPVPNRSYVLKSLWQTHREEETWEVQQISYCSFGMVTLQRMGMYTNRILRSISVQQQGQTGQAGTIPFHHNTSSLGFHQLLYCDLV